MSKTIKKCCTVLLSMFVAFVLLNAYCLVECFAPPYVPNDSGSTDNSFEPNTIFTNFREGAGYGVNDENGFNSGYSDADDADVLLMGSSHTEAHHVAIQNSCGSLLNDKIVSNSGKGRGVYNIGVSGHSLLVCLDNLGNAVSEYNPNCVIIETASVVFSDESIAEILQGNRTIIPSYDSGLLYELQKLPFAKRVWQQLEYTILKQDIDSENPTVSPSDYYAQLDALFANAMKAADGRKLVIFYHPTLSLLEDGSVETDTDASYLDAFENACSNNGITFVDMTDTFLEAFETRSVLPHGFPNTSVGAGHLNEEGHRMCAEALYDTLVEIGVC